MSTSRTHALALCLGLAAAGFSGCVADLHQTADNSASERYTESSRLLQEGIAAQKAGHLDSAAEFYLRSVELNPNSYAAWNNLGTVRTEQNRFLDAAAAFKRSAEVSTDPHDARPYENLGLVYNNAGFSEQALQYYQLALDRDANWLPALRGTALAARKLNKVDERLAETMRRALMIETDEKWREIFQGERLRIEGSLREQEKTRRDGR